MCYLGYSLGDHTFVWLFNWVAFIFFLLFFGISYFLYWSYTLPLCYWILVHHIWIVVQCMSFKQMFTSILMHSSILVSLPVLVLFTLYFQYVLFVYACSSYYLCTLLSIYSSIPLGNLQFGFRSHPCIIFYCLFF